MHLVRHRTQHPPDPVVRDLLTHAIWPPTPEHATDVLRETYGGSGADLYLLVENGDPVGLIGVRGTAPGAAVITHIAVTPDRRLCGIGRRIVEAVRRQASLRILIAETDRDAVDFYRRCGFMVESLGERYPGVERFLCTYSG